MSFIRNAGGLQYISAVAILQSVIVVIAFLGLGIVMRAHGYPHHEFFRWNSLPLFLRTHPEIFLALPLLWTAFAVWLEVKANHIARECSLVLAVILMFALIMTTLVAMSELGVFRMKI